ncbi:MAG: beta-propeller domain-containing protein [Acidimicrobiia bacterium]
MLRRKSTTVLIAILATALGACTASGALAETLPGGTTPEPIAIRAQGALVQFDACDSFLDHVISHAVDLVGPYGLEGFPGHWPGITFESSRLEGAGAVGGQAVPDFSGTNVQVEGVDEPDIVKTDGNRIVLVSNGQLIVVDVTGEEPVETGRLQIENFSVQTIFLSGDKVLLFGSIWNAQPVPFIEGDALIAPVPASPTVQIIEVDIGGEPEKVRTMTIDGWFISGRMVADSVRLVLTSAPVGFEWSYPKGNGLRAEREATEENREIIRNSTAENWIPYYVTTGADGAITDEGVLFDCDRAAHPEEFSGLDMLSVVTIDLGDGLDVVDATGVLATGDTVYASPGSLYVATQNWQTWRWLQTGAETDRPEGPSTEIHKFDITDPARTTYLASGSVDGHLLNQFTMDEHDGMLRVASTTTPNWWGSGPESESKVTVLREIGDSLVPIGEVDGLGKTEQIYSVRFMGDTAYVVTFRQTDPLYTLDLSDPRRPEVVGELKIPGYSAYLHPVGEGLLLGVGQDATDDGRIRGTQVSIFDVSDLSDPVRLDTYTLGEGTNSQIEYDHHAFLYWDGLAVIPVQQWWWDGSKDSGFMGAVGIRVGADGELTELATLVHPGGDGKDRDGRAQILRSVVIGDSVYTISSKGMMKSSLDTLDTEAWLDF